MRSSRLLLVVVLSSVGLVACRQDDGSLPVRDEEALNRIGDIARDLINVSRGQREAPVELTDDLVALGGERPGQEQVQALGQKTADVVATAKLTDEIAQKIAAGLWTVVSAREMSERQQETALDDLRAALVSAGLGLELVEVVAGRAGEVQKVVSTRTRRFYERF